MLTPLFELTQDDKFVKAFIYAPFAKVPETEIEFVGKEVLFSSNPYFLHIYLPDEVVENGEESASYDADTKKFTVHIPKKEVGKHFAGLDMITRLLTSPGKGDAKRPVEEMPAEGDSGEDEDGTRWLAEQVPAEASSSEPINRSRAHGYGFANRRHGIFSTMREEISEIVDIKCIDDVAIDERRKIAFQMESTKFNDEHYLADCYEGEQISELIELQSIVTTTAGSRDGPVTFSMDERDRLKELPRKQLTVSEEEEKVAMVSLVDIIFAYCYDYRTTMGEHTVESGWTISKLSSTLSCLVSWDDVKDAVVTCVRRSLCYPLCRNWKLALRVLNDVQEILRKGKSMILKCLLDIHGIFANDSEYRYIFNHLYITEYCVWIQDIQDSLLVVYADAIKKVSLTLTKAEVSLKLDELELAASLAMLAVDSEETQPKEDVTMSDELDSDDDA